MVLDEAAAHDDHARVDAVHGELVDQPQVGQDVDHEARVPERVEEEHVPETPVRERGAEHGNVVLVSPVVDGILVVDLLPKSVKLSVANSLSQILQAKLFNTRFPSTSTNSTVGSPLKRNFCFPPFFLSSFVDMISIESSNSVFFSFGGSPSKLFLISPTSHQTSPTILSSTP